MGKLLLRVLWAGVLLAGCGDDGMLPKDGGPDGGGDGGVRDGGGKAGGDASAGKGAGTFGARCDKDSDCGTKLFCDRQVDLSYMADNLPPESKLVKQSAFPGGVCTPVPAAAYTGSGGDSCDPTLPQAGQGCGADGVCVGVSVEQQQQVAACRPHCDPGAAKNTCRSSYACDFDLQACVEGCESDDECRLQLVDANGDGNPDSIAYDDNSKAQCDPNSFRCVHHGGGSGATGDPCQRLDDCEAEGLCVQPLQTFAGFSFPGGNCSKIGCDVSGRECSGDSAVCTHLRPWTPGLLTPAACFQSCKIGVEPASDQVGVHGHGDGCREGYRCHWNGGLRAGEGVCVGGNYNAVSKSNMGAACKVDKDCFSPFGLGRCLALSVGNLAAPTGTCTLMDCAVPGLPDNICGANADCVGLSGDVTFCVQRCKDASQCAAGFACTDDDGDAATSNVCYPVCRTDADCRKGSETCQIVPSTSATAPMIGQCVASGT